LGRDLEAPQKAARGQACLLVGAHQKGRTTPIGRSPPKGQAHQVAAAPGNEGCCRGDIGAKRKSAEPNKKSKKVKFASVVDVKGKREVNGVIHVTGLKHTDTAGSSEAAKYMLNCFATVDTKRCESS
jgi:hypothetical protein